jgi:DNA polymerase III delta subunit
MAKVPFSEKEIPKFADAPAAILVSGDVDFFVEEATTRVREALADKDTEVLRFEDDAPSEAVSDALLNRSLFAAQRIVELDISRLLGTDSPGRLVTKALEGWEKGGAGGRREAFKAARALLAALDLPAGGDPAENAEAAARRVRKKDDAPLLAEILKELPEEKSGGPAVLKAALRTLLERGGQDNKKNDGTVALLTAVSPPAGVDLLQEITARGLVLEKSVGEDPGPELRLLAAARAKEREVALDPGAIERLLARTDARRKEGRETAPRTDSASFLAELEKLLEWAGKGGRVRAADVEANVEDEASEDMYGFYDAIGRRDAGDALARLERLFDGRDVRQGDRAFEKIDEIWPIQLLGVIAGEVRRMLLLRARLDEAVPGGFDAGMSYATFQARVLPRLLATEGGKSSMHPFALYKASQRSSRFTVRELARALSRAADVDVRLKSSGPPLETLSAYLGELIAGR